MTSVPSPSDVDVEVGETTISAGVEVPVGAARMFDVVARPANHPDISGDHTVRGNRFGPEKVDAVGDRFGMSMKMFGLPYKMTSTVTEFEADRLITWRLAAGQTWSWSIEPLGDDRCRVTETFDMSGSKTKLPLRWLGFPGRHRDNLVKSVVNAASLAVR